VHSGKRAAHARFFRRTTFFLCKCKNYSENIFRLLMAFRGPGSVVGIATGYRLDGPGIESQWGRGFPHLSRPALGTTHPPENGYRFFPGGKSCRGVKLTPHPFLVPWSRKGRAILLLPLWAVRPVQSFSACTRAHFTFLPLWRFGCLCSFLHPGLN
jgi:hypothetical protein